MATIHGSVPLLTMSGQFAKASTATVTDTWARLRSQNHASPPTRTTRKPIRNTRRVQVTGHSNGIGGFTTNQPSGLAATQTGKHNAGGDLKLGITADVTVNTDFAQVEEDEQQANLTSIVRMPEGDFTSTLFSTRATYTVNPRMSASALVQYNSSASSVNTNIRFRSEYRPGSDFFVVLTDNRDTLSSGFPELRNRALLVKMTRLFRL